MDDNILGPRDEIAFFLDSNDPTPSVDFAGDLLKESHIILQLAFRSAGDTHAYGVFFHNGETKWEEIDFIWQQDDIPQYDSDGNEIHTDEESD